jgi:hypothetical protein
LWKKFNSRGFLEEKTENKKRDRERKVFLLRKSEGEKGREQA